MTGTGVSIEAELIARVGLQGYTILIELDIVATGNSCNFCCIRTAITWSGHHEAPLTIGIKGSDDKIASFSFILIVDGAVIICPFPDWVGVI